MGWLPWQWFNGYDWIVIFWAVEIVSLGLVLLTLTLAQAGFFDEDDSE
jgi:hypothetical protein